VCACSACVCVSMREEKVVDFDECHTGMHVSANIHTHKSRIRQIHTYIKTYIHAFIRTSGTTAGKVSYKAE
jgi:hypothetical protein